MRIGVDSKYQELQEDTNGCSHSHACLHTRRLKDAHLFLAVKDLSRSANKLVSTFGTELALQQLVLDLILLGTSCLALLLFVLCSSPLAHSNHFH